MKSRLALAIFLGCVIPTLACNFPFRAPPSDSHDELPRTLTAMAIADQVIGTPEPVGGNDPDSTQLDGSPPEDQSAIGALRPSMPVLVDNGEFFTYTTHTGDTLSGVANRFGVEPDDITSPNSIPPQGLLPPGLELTIPNMIGETKYPEVLLPDSEIIYSPSTTDFQIQEFVNNADGYLSTHGEQVNGEWLSGAEIVQKVAQENSINPRILLALLEYRSGWVFSQPADTSLISYPIGFYVPDYEGLYYELVLTATHLGVGYYGWRSGALTWLTFPDDSTMRLSPGLNPGSVALQTLMSKLVDQDEWRESLYGPVGVLSVHEQMFGDPWTRAAKVEPIIPPNLTPPTMELPFTPGERWSFTGGPHLSWNSGSPRGAVDFSPVTGDVPCAPSRAWVTASAAGMVTRAGDSVVAIDLDGDGNEQTGWVLVYLHIPDQDRISPGTMVEVDQPIGHPSCERGNSTGTNVHLARKYNGEWLPADRFLPFILSDWEVEAGEKSYQGVLRKGDQIVSANPGGPSSSIITREE